MKRWSSRRFGASPIVDRLVILASPVCPFPPACDGMAGNDNQPPAGFFRRGGRLALAAPFGLVAAAAFRRGLVAVSLRGDRFADSRRTSATTTQTASPTPRPASNQNGFTPQPPVAQ